MTDSNQKPLVPNYVPDVGRLVTDRFDFQQHVDGTAFNHNASAINCSPLITINGDGYANVQTALFALSQNLIPPTVSNATTSSVGLIQLAGDIAGTATSVKVTGLRGFPIQNLAPTTNQFLSYNGSAWTPTTLPTGWSGPAIASNRTVTSTTYTVDSISPDLFIFCNISAPLTITLPPPTAGRVLIIIATVNFLTAGMITIAPNASELIEGLATSYVYMTDYGTVRLISDSVNWWIW